MYCTAGGRSTTPVSRLPRVASERVRRFGRLKRRAKVLEGGGEGRAGGSRRGLRRDRAHEDGLEVCRCSDDLWLPSNRHTQTLPLHTLAFPFNKTPRLLSLARRATSALQ